MKPRRTGREGLLAFDTTQAVIVLLFVATIATHQKLFLIPAFIGIAFEIYLFLKHGIVRVTDDTSSEKEN